MLGTLTTFVSKMVTTTIPVATVKNGESFIPEDETSFRKVFPKLRQDLVEVCENCGFIESTKWFGKVLDYNVPHGKVQRGLLVVNTFKALTNNPTSEQMNSARILGWCGELLQTSSLIADDMMDSSPLRRGRPSWFTVDGVGMNAINDAFYLESCAYHLLKKYFGETEFYTKFVDAFHDITLKTIIGQNLDVLACQEISEERCKMANFFKIAEYKTGYYTFVLPIRLGAILAGLQDGKLLNHLESVGLQLGEIFQAQDDFLDVYCTITQTGKSGTDIAEGKCTWLICKAMEIANPEQREILMATYGKKDEESVQVVRTIFDEINLPYHFRHYHEELMDKIGTQIAAISGDHVQLKAMLNTLVKKMEIAKFLILVHV
ncbi:farnesyl pyrophosphate synthase isoform X3 [Folsomia candida]|nr:farnesyl pyrophosphate synthase isoform X3 [Folsomia candida]